MSTVKTGSMGGDIQETRELKGQPPKNICARPDQSGGVLCINRPGHQGRCSWDPTDGPNGVWEPDPK